MFEEELDNPELIAKKRLSGVIEPPLLFNPIAEEDK